MSGSSNYTRFPSPGSSSSTYTRFPALASGGGGGSLLYGSSMVPSAGTTLVLELVDTGTGPTIPSSSPTGFTIQVNGATVTPTSITRTASDEYTFSISPTIDSTDTVTIAYTPGNVTNSSFDQLETFTAKTVTNNSTQSAYDSDAIIYFNNITTNSGTISTAAKGYINTFVLALKAASYSGGGTLWSSFWELYPIAGDQLAAAQVKLKYSTVVGAFLTNNNFVSGDYTQSTGIAGDGSSKYLSNAMDIPTVSGANISFGSYQRVDSSATGTRLYMGSSYAPSGDTNRCYLVGNTNNSGLTGRMGLGSLTTLSGCDGTGLRTLTYNGTAGTAAVYQNNTSFSSTTGLGNLTWQQTGTFQLLSVGGSSFASDAVMNFAFVGKAMTSGDMTSFYSAVQALQTSLGRQV